MTTEDSPKLLPRRWKSLIELLSLDEVRPFFDKMGVVLQGLRESQVWSPLPGQEILHQQRDKATGLQKVLREVMMELHERAAEDPDAHLPTPQEIIARVSDSLGESAGRHLAWWNDSVFHCDPRYDNVNESRWSSLLHHCRKSRWAELGLPEGVGPEQFLRAQRIDAYLALQAEVDARLLSDWDLHVYTQNLYDDKLDEDAYSMTQGPRIFLNLTIRAYRGHQFWVGVLPQMNPEQRDHLWQQALRIAHEDKLYKPDTLEHPDNLDIWKHLESRP